MRIHIPEI
jgi:hypothetical protein